MSTATVLEFPMQPAGSSAPEPGGPEAFGPLPELPNAHQRWTVRRKAMVVGAVRGGWIPIEEVCAVYSISVDEFLAWERDLDRYGVHGLRTTRYQIYRDTDKRAPAVSGTVMLNRQGSAVPKKRRTLACDVREPNLRGIHQ